VALARALVVEPKVLLFDEPLSNLDAKLRIQMRDEIRRLRGELGFTALYVTHDQEEAMSLSDRIVVMNRGRIEQIGTPEEVYNRPRSRFVADFIGKKVNFVPGTVTAVTGRQIGVAALGGSLDWEPGDERVLSGVRTGARILLVIRPEAVELRPKDGPRPEGGSPAASAPSLPGRVRKLTYLGSEAVYEVEVAGQILTVQQPNPGEAGLHPPGAAVDVAVHTHSLHILPAGPEDSVACSG
jgi:iron(III) transport system ATP-binding protein